MYIAFIPHLQFYYELYRAVTSSAFQLYTLLRYLNEVQQNEQQMISSTTDSTHNMTDLSTADSGTGMSEDDVTLDRPINNGSMPRSPVRYAPRISYVFADVDGGAQASTGGGQQANSSNKHRAKRPTTQGVLKPDEYYNDVSQASAANYESPRIVINTKQKARKGNNGGASGSGLFNLKSPKKTIAKMKLMQSFQPVPSEEADTPCSLPHSRSMPMSSAAGRRTSSDSCSTEKQSSNSSAVSMNSTQTYRNSRKPVTMGTFKPELANKR